MTYGSLANIECYCAEELDDGGGSGSSGSECELIFECQVR